MNKYTKRGVLYVAALTIAAVSVGLAGAAYTSSKAYGSQQQATITGCGQVSQASTFTEADNALPWVCYIDTQGRQLTEFIIWAVFTRWTPEAQIQVQWIDEGEIADVSIALAHGNRYITLVRNPD